MVMIFVYAWSVKTIFAFCPAIGIVLFLARYFSYTTMAGIKSIKGIILPIIMTLLPVALIFLQPDLGTSLMLLFTAVIILFVVGVQWWKFALVGVSGAALLPVAWGFLHEYQQNRVLTFLNPEINKNHAQLLFTTHDTWQLSNQLLRRDEIWFAKKDNDGLSSLYSLADFVDEDGVRIRKDESYEKNYMVGKYGAIPDLKSIDMFKED
jgi:hypothetical protein